MSDLMRENDDGVSVMQWLRSAYPQDWDNLLERLKPMLGGLDPRWVGGHRFGGLGECCQADFEEAQTTATCGTPSSVQSAFLELDSS
jgi:hypothetical protein